MIYLQSQSTSKMAFQKQMILQCVPYKTIIAMFDNAVNTRFVYDTIMHIFACKNG